MTLPGWQRGWLCLCGMMLASAATAETVMTTNYIVEAPTSKLAEQIAERAETRRELVAIELFGDLLPDAAARSTVRVAVADGDCRARTLPAPRGQGHFVTLKGPIEELCGASLDHEVLHTTLADAVGKDFPPWLNEGLACRFDNERLVAIRRREIRDMVVERTWPDLRELLSSPIRTRKQYAVAESITAYLLRDNDPARLVEFGVEVERVGIDAALRSCLGIASVEQLDQAWRGDLQRTAMAHRQRR